MKKEKKIVYEGNMRITIEEVSPEEEEQEEQGYEEGPEQMPSYPPYYPPPYMIDPNQQEQQPLPPPMQQRPIPPQMSPPPMPYPRRIQDNIRNLPPLPPVPQPRQDFKEEVELQEPPADEVAEFLRSHPNAFQTPPEPTQSQQEQKKKGFLGFGKKKK